MVKEILVEISWLRPLKLIGLANLFCGIIAFILSMVLQDWVVTDDADDAVNSYYMGIWTRCIRHRTLNTDYANQTAAPVKEESDYVCSDATELGAYISVVQALIVIPFIIALVAFVLGCIAYCKREWRLLYKIAGVILIIGAIGVLIAVIVFPIMFLNDLPFYAYFWFWWGYGIAWAALCFILTAAILFLISSDKKEIYHTEKKMLI